AGTVWMRGGWARLNTLTSRGAGIPHAAVEALGVSPGPAGLDAPGQGGPGALSPLELYTAREGGRAPHPAPGGRNKRGTGRGGTVLVEEEVSDPGQQIARDEPR